MRTHFTCNSITTEIKKMQILRINFKELLKEMGQNCCLKILVPTGAPAYIV
jgi:hypothetical protein